MRQGRAGLHGFLRPAGIAWPIPMLCGKVNGCVVMNNMASGVNGIGVMGGGIVLWEIFMLYFFMYVVIGHFIRCRRAP